MKCSKCGHEIRETAKFCDECGTNLHLTGSSLESLPRSSRAGVASEPERKRVTALFSDLTGYTAMTEKLDPEQVKEITGRIFTGVKEIVAKYEGFIERVMGDGCLAFFGIPRAHEDDPIRAIHSAMEIHDLVKKLSPQYEARVGAPLTMHSGVNTGLVVTADVNPEKGTHGVAGDAVNVASRLSGMAGPGEILAGEETVRRAKGRFVFDDLGQKQAKGKAEPITVFKFISVRAPAKDIGMDRQVSSEMVGRDRELDKLEFQVMKAINGQGSVVNVIGEAGIGKSRLIAELKKSHIIERVTLLEGRAISIGKNLSFHPITDLLKQWAGIGEADSEAAAFDKLEKSIRQVHSEETNEILPFVATLMGMKLTGKHAERIKGIEGEALEKLFFKNIRELVIKGAELRPTVVVMEDLHWADTSSIELLDGLYRLAEKHSIAFINVFRPGYFDSDDGNVANIGRRLPANYVEITIQPLDKSNSETLINNMVAIKGLPYNVKHQILERAGGNPFFIEEVVRSLIDEGAVVKGNGVFEVTEKIENVVIPPTINDVLMARIDRLEERTRELVKVASVIGRSFFDRIIKDVADSIEDVDNRLEYLKDVQLIRDRTRMQELEYLFKHALAQEAAYESTLLQQRRALHLKVAQSIEKLFQERLHEFYGMLAYHYSRGGDLEKAEEYITKAGEEALRSSASSEALNYFQEALKIYVNRVGDDADLEKLANFEKNIALALYNKGLYPDAVRYFDQVLERWGVGSPRYRMLLWCGLVFDLINVLANLYLPRQSRAEIPDSRTNEIFDLAYKRDSALVYYDIDRLVFEHFKFMSMCCRFDASKIVNGVQWWVSNIGVFSAIGLSMGVAAKFSQRTNCIVEKDNIRHVAAYNWFSSAHNLTSGGWSALECYDQTAVDMGLRIGEFWHTASYAWVVGTTRVEQGRFEDAEFIVEKLSEMTNLYDYEIAGIYSDELKANLLMKMGRLHDARQVVEALISSSSQKGLDEWLLRGLGEKAIIDMMLENVMEARNALSPAGDLASVRSFIPPVYLAPYVLGQLLTSVHELKAASVSNDLSSLSRLRKRCSQKVTAAARNARKYAPAKTWILRSAGEYYWLIDKQRKALKWWDKSIKEGERLGARPDLSRTYFEVGKRLLEPQSKYKQLNGIDAKGYLDKAEELFREMRLEHDLDELERVRQGT
jgi:class 3 adenylate cyclase/tetratricopeptide (TPR) repeat protein